MIATLRIRMQDEFDPQNGYSYKYADFPYSDTTTIYEMKLFVAQSCGDDYIMGDVLLDYNGEANRHLIEEVKFRELVSFLGTSHVTVTYPYGWGAGYARIDGLKYYFHSNESGHTPHIHVDYQGESISIDLLTDEVAGTFKNPKKFRKARIYAFSHKDELIKAFYEHSHGIYVHEFEVM